MFSCNLLSYSEIDVQKDQMSCIVTVVESFGNKLCFVVDVVY